MTVDTRVASLPVIAEAAALVDDSGVVEKLVKWDAQDQVYRGGRPSTLTMRAVLIAWIAVVLSELPPHVSRVSEMLTAHLSPQAAEILGLPASYADLRPETMYDRVHRMTTRMLDALDGLPLPTRHEALTEPQWAEVQSDRAERRDELETKRLRFFHVANQLLHTQYLTLPETVRTEAVSVTVDATFMRSFSHAWPKKNPNRNRTEPVVSADPDAGWYKREKKDDVNIDDEFEFETVEKSGWGREFELAVLISNDPQQRDAVPHIALGFGHHKPSVNPSGSIMEVLNDIRDRGLTIDHAVGDQAYMPNAKAEVLQNPLRRAGVKLVMKYPKPGARAAKPIGDIQETAHGANLIEGQWYCPAMPKTLQEAQLDYYRRLRGDYGNKSLTPEEKEARKLQYRQERDQRVQQRVVYELRQKEKPDERGRVPMMCPGVGKSRTVNCPLKPQVAAPAAGVVPIPILKPPKAPGDICRNKVSTSFHLDEGGKYQQHYRYLSKEWQTAYTYGRQVVESFNAGLKESSTLNLGDASRRRLRGATAQAFMTLLGVIAVNSRRIHEFAEQSAVEAAPAAFDRRTRTSRKQMPAARRRYAGVVQVPVGKTSSRPLVNA